MAGLGTVLAAKTQLSPTSKVHDPQPFSRSRFEGVEFKQRFTKNTNMSLEFHNASGRLIGLDPVFDVC